jgi:uncharacterized protein
LACFELVAFKQFHKQFERANFSVSQTIQPLCCQLKPTPITGMPKPPQKRKLSMSDPVVTKEDVLEKSRGTLQKQFYVVFTTPVNGIVPILENLKEHLEFQHSLEQRGIMFGAGPFWDDADKNWHGEGMVIIRAASMDEARKIAESDPMHASGARSFTIRPWLMNEGTVTIKVNFSDGTREVI